MGELAGQKFNRWTVLEEVGRRNGGRRVAVRCDCGTIREVYFQEVKSGRSKSCGCLMRESARKRALSKGVNLESATSGLLCYKMDTKPASNGKRRILCVCACGNEKEVNAASFIKGEILSCGCLHRLASTERLREARSKRKPVPNLEGHEFGRYRVLEKAPRESRDLKWIIRCKICGYEAHSTTRSVQDGRQPWCKCTPWRNPNPNMKGDK